MDKGFVDMTVRFVRHASIFLLVAVVLSAAMMVGCRKDIFVEPPLSLIGRYTGVYRFTAVKNGIDTIKDESQYITWQFKSQEYLMLYDSTNHHPLPTDTTTDRQFCDNKGIYDLSSGITITVNSDGKNLRNSPCNTDENPDGFFSLDQSRADTIYILQIVQNPSSNAEESRLIKLVHDTSI